MARTKGMSVINLYDAKTNNKLGSISEEQLSFLQDQFEEEWDGDKDYYINEATIDMLKGAGADAHLLELLQRALGDGGEGDVRWADE
jgi:hypothetical protein